MHTVEQQSDLTSHRLGFCPTTLTLTLACPGTGFEDCTAWYGGALNATAASASVSLAAGRWAFWEITGLLLHTDVTVNADSASDGTDHVA